MTKLTIHEILQVAYATGTERSKYWIPMPPDVKKLRPLREVEFKSVVSKAKRRKKYIANKRASK